MSLLERPSELPRPAAEGTLQRALAFFAFLMGFGPPLSIFLANAAVIGFALLWILALATKRDPWRPVRTPYDVPLAAYLAVWAAACYGSLDAIGSFKKIGAEIHFLPLYLLLWAEGGRHLRTALRGYLWGAGVAVAYGLGQYVYWNLILNNVPPPWYDGLSRSLRIYIGLHGGRVHGAMHPLTYAEQILPSFFFAASAFLDAAGGKDRLKKAAAFLAVGLALLLSQSRGPWLGALAGLVLIAALHRRRLWLLGPLLILGILFVANPGTRQRAATLSQASHPSTANRLDLWRTGIYIARRHFWHGVGPGQVRQIADLYKDRPDFPKSSDRLWGDMHNLYIQQLVSKGVFGLLSVLGLLLAPLWASWRAWRGSEGPDKSLALGLMAAFAATMVFNVTERAFEDAEVALLFWILAAAAASLIRRSTEKI